MNAVYMATTFEAKSAITQLISEILPRCLLAPSGGFSVSAFE